VSRTAPLAALVLVPLAVLAAGCRSKTHAPPRRGRPAATVLVTRGFGAQRVAFARVAPGEDAISALRGVARVGTSYGGRFVQSVNGIAGSRSGQRDWFVSLDGLELPVGAGEVTLHAGDRLWWDLHSWRDFMGVPALVGAFPEPFLHGDHGHAPPLTLPAGPLGVALRHAGYRPPRAGGRPWRLLVGSDAALRRDPDYRALARRGTAAPLLAFVRGGRVLVYDGARWTTRSAARVAVWAGKTPDGRVVMAIAGLDAASAERAAAAIARQPSLLAGRYAAAFDGQGHVVASGGRP
jgi:hypothetical protein